MKLSDLIADLQEIKRKEGDVDVLLFGLDNEEAELTVIKAEWSEFFKHYYVVLATDNYPGEQ